MSRVSGGVGRPARHILRDAMIPFLAFFFLLLPGVLRAASADPAWGRNGIVATAHPLATEAALRVLQEGGNAMDAALAAVYTLDVVTGYSLGLGGGEFWVIRRADTGEVLTVDGRETAPAAATREMYLDSAGAVIPGLSSAGVLSGGVPGSVAAREYIFEHFATLRRPRLLRDAIRAAGEGFLVTPRDEEVYAVSQPLFERFETTRKVMLKPDGTTYRAGDILVQADLARTLKRIAQDGAREFYEGETAREIARYMAEHGGLITLEDLAGYRVEIREPVHGTYRGYDIFSMPPPSSGGVHLVQMLNILEGWDLPQFGRYSARYYHHLAEVMEAAFADRAEYLGDPAFYDVPVRGLTSKEYAAELRDRIPDLWARKVKGPGEPRAYEEADTSGFGRGHTSHLSIIDRWGNMVALTSSVNTWFGSGVILGNTGIFLNNTMDDFSLRPGYPNFYGLVGSEANAIAPGKRPLSSMTPTLILLDGKPFMAVGAAGGPRIITGTLQVILNVIDFGADIQNAVSDPRIHHQWKPDYLLLDLDISPDCASTLHAMGHTLLYRPTGSAVQGVMRDPETGMMFGGADPRAGGSAAGVP